MKPIFFLLIASALFAQDASKQAAPQQMPTIPAAAASTNEKSILMIEPKMRAADFVQAFDLLRKDKPTLQLMLRTSNNLIMNVTDVTAASSGTLLFVKVLSNQGTRIQVVPIEEMMEITYSP